MGMDISCKILVGIKIEDVGPSDEFDPDDLPTGWDSECFAPDYREFKDDEMWHLDNHNNGDNFYGVEIQTVDCYRDPNCISHDPKEIINRIEQAVARFKNLYNLEPKIWFIPEVS